MSEEGRRRGTWVRLLLWGLVALALLLAAAAVFFWKRPLSVFEAMGRFGLRAAGFTRLTLDTPRGPLAYWRGGQGDTVILLHGANDYAGAWAKVAGPLAASHRVVVPDLPGHGYSAPASGALSFDDILAGVERLVEAEPGDGRVTLVGNSMGGLLALLFARKHPDRVRGVVLVNGAALSGDAKGINLLPRTREEARRATQALTGPGAPPVPGFILDDLVRRAPLSPLARLLRSDAAGSSLDGHLGEIQAPATLLWGEADQLLPPEYARRVAQELPNARLTLIPGCGHLPQRECSAKLLPLLREALSPVPRAAPN